MPKVPVVLLSAVLAAMLHVDWHLARPAQERLSLAWSHHWVATGIVFAIAGCIIAQRWPSDRWRLGGVIFVVAVIVAQLVEPVLEVLLYEGRLGYDGEPERWAAFGRAMAAATPAYWATLWLCARPHRAADLHSEPPVR